MKSIIIIIFFIFITSCSKSQMPTDPYSDCSFAIYFLKDTSIKMNHLVSMDLTELQLESTPWLSDKDIYFYDWSSHCIYLKQDKHHFFPDWKFYYIFPESWADKPFIVKANGITCYVGYMDHGAFSAWWLAPNMNEGDVGGYPIDVLHYQWVWPFQEDPRNNEQTKEALIQLGLYHGGISVAFDTVDALHFIEISDTTTIEYTFKLTNLDQDDLYIFDPAKVENDLFHAYHNGPVFYNINNKTQYESIYKKIKTPVAYTYWSPEWFSKLKSGESIVRTLTLKGYPFMPSGEYVFSFSFSGPVFNMKKEKRVLSDGRYWLGPTKTDIHTFILEDNNIISNIKTIKFSEYKLIAKMK